MPPENPFDPSQQTAEADEKKIKQQAQIDEMASDLHEEWRAPRKQEDGTYEPRMKETRDQAWIERTGAETRLDDRGRVTSEVDIANTEYKDLPSEWQAENKVSAEVSLDLVNIAIEAGKPLDEGLIEDVSAVVHEKWLERNGEWAPEEQKKPYSELSEEEKEKDRIFIRKAITIATKE
ncbi:MAG: hypothetical protein WCP14_03750 [bacterium]